LHDKVRTGKERGIKTCHVKGKSFQRKKERRAGGKRRVADRGKGSSAWEEGGKLEEKRGGYLTGKGKKETMFAKKKVNRTPKGQVKKKKKARTIGTKNSAGGPKVKAQKEKGPGGFTWKDQGRIMFVPV